MHKNKSHSYGITSQSKKIDDVYKESSNKYFNCSSSTIFVELK